MKGKNFVIFVFTVFLIAACSSQPNKVTTSASQPETDQNSTSSAVSQSESFRAETTSAVSVMLSWEPVESVTHYTLDLSFGGDFFTIQTFAPEQTSYEDFPVPDNTELSYRLRAFSGSEQILEKTFILTTPPIQPNPAVLEVHEFEPVSPLANLQIPTIDPNNPNYDPSAYVIPGYNPETGEIDMSALMDEPVATTAEIGPEGGTVSVTAPNNIIYTLYIPPSALEEITTITMTPIESIDGLPLDNFLGAVRMAPNGLLFETPALLTYTFPGETVISEDLVTMNFAYDGSNNEFYFVPYFNGVLSDIAFAALSSGKTASPAPRLLLAGPLSGLAIQQLGPFGVGQGSPDQVRSVIKHKAPTKVSAQKSNLTAGAQIEDDLAPLVLIPEDDLAPLTPHNLLTVNAEVNSAQTAKELAVAIKDFESYIIVNGEPESMKQFTNPIWDQIVDKTKKVFEENKTMCLTENAFVAQAIGGRLQSLVGKFWRTFSEKFKAKHGDQLLQDMSDLINKCKFQFIFNSDVTIIVREDGGPPTKTNAKVKTEFMLKIKLDPLGEPVLYGKGKLVYQRQPTLTVDMCSPMTTEIKLNNLQKSTFDIYAIRPQWKPDGTLKDFWLDVYVLAGKQDKPSFSCKDKYGDLHYANGRSINGETGDLWGGLFATSHFPNEQLIRDWKISPAVAPTVSGGGLLAERIYQKINEDTFFGGEATETTTVQIIKLAGTP